MRIATRGLVVALLWAASVSLLLPALAGAQDLPVLQRGDRGPEVEYWQDELNQWRSYAQPGRGPLDEDGVFGPRTESAVRALQRDAGIAVDGIVGPTTWRALYRLLGTRAEVLIARSGSITPEWPIPVPSWFWEWAQWYLGHAEYADAARAPAARPAAAPTVIPNWAWRRMLALDGRSEELRARRLLQHRLGALFGPGDTTVRDLVRSELAPGWMFAYGAHAGTSPQSFAAWLRLVDGRWVPWEIGRLGAQLTLEPALVPCDVKPAFSEPQC